MVRGLHPGGGGSAFRGGGQYPRGGGLHPTGLPQGEGSASRGLDRPPVVTSSGSHCSGQYASYWNAFLFLNKNMLIFRCVL